jgi:hypothetical protein
LVKPKGTKDSQAHKAPLTSAPPVPQRSGLAWPWGLVAIGTMALAWVGIYLLWNGVVFLLSL